jgi:hypothetical protein
MLRCVGTACPSPPLADRRRWPPMLAVPPRTMGGKNTLVRYLGEFELMTALMLAWTLARMTVRIMRRRAMR